MSKFLAKIPGEQSWREVELTTYRELDEFVGGRADVIPLSMGINLYMNDGLITKIESQPFNFCLSLNSYVSPIYGNVVVASEGESDDIVPLNQEQTKHLYASSHAMTLPSGLKIMHLCPSGFRLEHIEPLRMLGEVLREMVTTNNQVSDSDFVAAWTGEGNNNHESNWK